MMNREIGLKEILITILIILAIILFVLIYFGWSIPTGVEIPYDCMPVGRRPLEDPGFLVERLDRIFPGYIKENCVVY